MGIVGKESQEKDRPGKQKLRESPFHEPEGQGQKKKAGDSKKKKTERSLDRSPTGRKKT